MRGLPESPKQPLWPSSPPQQNTCSQCSLLLLSEYLREVSGDNYPDLAAAEGADGVAADLVRDHGQLQLLQRGGRHPAAAVGVGLGVGAADQAPACTQRWGSRG